MKPIIIIPPDTMSEEHIKLLRENDLCVVVAKDPSKVKFVDPIPAMSSRTQIESAAIKLSRILLNKQWGHVSQSNLIGQDEFSKLYVKLLIEGTQLESGYIDDPQLKAEHAAKKVPFKK